MHLLFFFVRANRKVLGANLEGIGMQLAKMVIVGIVGVVAGISFSQQAHARTPERMMQECRVRAGEVLRTRLPNIETKYEGQRTDGTHAVNGTARIRGRTTTFQCSFNRAGTQIVNFVVNKPTAGQPENLPSQPNQQRPRPGSWEQLGCQKVGFIKDRDVINVGRKEGRFSAIRLNVRGNKIHLLDLKVIYGNGQPDDLQVRRQIPAGGQTRAIDLKGRDRFIDRIEMTYRSRPSFRGQATVCVDGRHG